MSVKLNQSGEGGNISACEACSHICGYGCCNQALPHEADFGPESSLLLYPGELEAAIEASRRHILVNEDDFYGGKLGYCDRKNFDQSQCSADRNLKPLDCQSYPFFPAIVDGELVLKVDRKRCPLPAEAVLGHYKAVLEKWRAAIAKNPAVREWINSFQLEGYTDFNPASL